MKLLNIIFFVCLAVFVLALFLTIIARRLAISTQLLDIPNERSSHTKPTPKNGGIAVIIAWLGGALIFIQAGIIDWQALLLIGPPSLVIAITGFIDDRRGLSALLRIFVHFFCAGWFVALLEPAVSTGFEFVDATPILVALLCVLALVWLINLFNFMDGIDGLAGVEAVFVSAAIFIFCWFSGESELAAICAILAASCAGFLVMNWPPARIFIGNMGSSWVGFMLGVIAIYSSANTGVNIWPWTILLGVFLVDATVTLIRRMASGQKWYEAHRSHGYQILSRRWGGHRPVTLMVTLVNIVWLAPMAIWAYVGQVDSRLVATIALAPIVCAVVWLRAGRKEELAAEHRIKTMG